MAEPKSTCFTAPPFFQFLSFSSPAWVDSMYTRGRSSARAVDGNNTNPIRAILNNMIASPLVSRLLCESFFIYGREGNFASTFPTRSLRPRELHRPEVGIGRRDAAGVVLAKIAAVAGRVGDNPRPCRRDISSSREREAVSPIRGRPSGDPCPCRSRRHRAGRSAASPAGVQAGRWRRSPGEFRLRFS